MARMMRAKLYMELWVGNRADPSKRIEVNQGVEYDFDREVDPVDNPGFTFAEAVKGREDCFEDVNPTHPNLVHAEDVHA